MEARDDKSLVLAVCGASGQLYARWILKRMLEDRRAVHVIASPASRGICRDELGLDGITFGLDDGLLTSHECDHMDSPLASGSYPTAGMIICPCTLNTLAAVAGGISDNLIKRAAQVHLKQRRPLVLAVRETPLTVIDLDNMLRLAHAGAIVAPLSPAFYPKPRDLDQLAAFTAERLIELAMGISPRYQYRGRGGE